MARLGLVVFLCGIACANLDPIDTDVCGNDVLEKGEDCDFFGEGAPACGAPLSANACFFTCEAGLAESCPVGFGCGLDGRCRAASGEFSATAPFSFPVDRFEIGDYDGDGFPDIVGESQTRLFVGFSSASGEIGTVRNAATDAPRPFMSLGQLSGDDRIDIVSATQAGINLHLGAGDRELIAETFPIFSFVDPSTHLLGRVGITRGPDDFAANEFVVLSFLGGAVGVSIGFGPGGADLEALIGRAIARASVHTPLATGNLNATPNDELVFTQDGADRLWVLALGAAAPYASVSAQLMLPALTLARGRPFLVDVDDDNDLDIALAVVDTANVEVATVALFLNLGNGSFSVGLKIPTPVLSPAAEILALAPLDDSAGAETVTSQGVAVDGGFIFGNWRAAAVADMNGDGHPDLIAVPSAAPGVEIYLNVPGGPGFNRFTAGTSAFSAGTGDLIVGDFDGDFITDAILTAPAPSGEMEIRVLYGKESGGFDDPEVKARFDAISQVLLTVSEDGTTVSNALVVELTSSPEPGYALAFLEGDGSRSLLAPLLLFDLEAGPTDPELQFPLNAVVARLGPPDDGPGVIATAFGFDDPTNPAPNRCVSIDEATDCTYAWAIPGDGQGGLLREERTLTPLGLTVQELLCRNVAPADVLGRGYDQLVMWVADAACLGAAAIADGRFTVNDLTTGDSLDVQIGPEIGVIADVVVADLDNDGLAEIALSFRARPSDGTVGLDGGVAIFRPGTASPPQILSLPRFRPAALAAEDFDGDGLLELAIAGVQGDLGGGSPAVWVASWDEEANEYSPPQENASLSVGGFARIADMNSDGVIDLVVGNGLTATVLLGVPLPPRGSTDLAAPAGEGN